MANYKELFYKSQAEISNAIDILENTINSLENCLLECENEIMQETKTNIIEFIPKITSQQYK